MNEEKPKKEVKLGAQLIGIYALESEDGKMVGISVASPLNKDEIIRTLGVAQHQMLTQPGHDMISEDDIDNVDLGGKFAEFKTKQFKIKVQKKKP